MDNKRQYTAPCAKAVKIETGCILAGSTRSTTGNIEDGKLEGFDDLFTSSSNTDNEDGE